MLDATSGDEALDTRTRAALLEVLKNGVTAESIARMLPRLYTNLLSDDQVVRAAAIGLWQASARVVKTLPDDLGALAPHLLRDPYLIVHGTMAAAVTYLGLSDVVARSLCQPLANIAAAHRDDNKEILRDALLGLLWAAQTANGDLINHAASFAIQLSSALDTYQRESVLLNSALIPQRSTQAWATAAMRLLADSARGGFSVSPRVDHVLAALVDQPSGVASVPFEMFQALSAIHGPSSLGRSAEMIELLQAAGRWREALQLATDAAAAIPRTEEFRSRYKRFEFIVLAAAAECTVFEGAGLDNDKLASEQREVASGSLYEPHIRARASVRKTLSVLPLADPDASAHLLEQNANLMESTPGGDVRVDAFIPALRITAQLLRYDAALRTAASNAPALLVAARRSAAVLLSTTEGSLPASDRIRQFADRATAATADNADEVVALVARIPLALPFCDRAFSKIRRAKPENRRGADDNAAQEEAPIAVCILALNGSPALDVQVLREESVHDLTLDMRVREWPEWADACRVQLLSTLPEDVLVLPKFEFCCEKTHDDSYGVLLSKKGTLMFRSTRPPGSEPLDLTLHVQFRSVEGDWRDAIVAGYERLRLRPYDPSRDVLTHHAQMDQRLLEMFAELYGDKALDPADIEAFSRFFTACVKAGQEIMFDKAFRAGSKVSETQFHNALEEYLRRDPELEGRLTRRDEVAGGFDDLMHDGTVAELKVEKTTTRTVEDCARYVGQPTQHGVGRGSRLSILVILDQTKKISTAGSSRKPYGMDVPVAARP